MPEESFHDGIEVQRQYACSAIRRSTRGSARSRGHRFTLVPATDLPPVVSSVRHFGRLNDLRSLFCNLVARLGSTHGSPRSLVDFISAGLDGSANGLGAGSGLVLLVTDLAGFTPLVEELGDARARAVMRLHNALLRKYVRENAGIEVTHTGDGIIACFRSAPDAVSCAMQIQTGVSRVNARSSNPALHVRIGIHQGAPLLEEDRLFGAAVVAAVRICSHCEPDHILASKPVHASAHMLRSRFQSHGEHSLKGFRERFELFDVRWSARRMCQGRSDALNLATASP
jgi:class 3 adenylate cyclase